ncbi:hypothetical protein EON79_09340 [bacterium]|nr:MAG: hypothetical protein EON79_09340 [bacterium]
MSVAPGTLLSVAESLARLSQGELGAERSEAIARAAIGRAYYAAYHATLLAAHQAGYVPSAGSGHYDLWFRWCREEGWNVDLGFAGENLRNKRTRADYHIDRPLRDNPIVVVEEAKEIFRAIADNYPS